MVLLIKLAGVTRQYTLLYYSVSFSRDAKYLAPTQMIVTLVQSPQLRSFCGVYYTARLSFIFSNPVALVTVLLLKGGCPLLRASSSGPRSETCQDHGTAYHARSEI